MTNPSFDPFTSALPGMPLNPFAMPPPAPGHTPGTKASPGNPWMGRIFQLLSILLWIGKNFLAWLCGYVCCYVVLMVYYGPAGIVQHLVPYCGMSVLLMVASGCVIRLYDFLASKRTEFVTRKVKDSILERAPQLD
eukprot:NODE_5327_length_669_cov_15.839483_g5164_i0.p2 GENE.NODE_5327_length_669_cov_15.839483_g5164_i0~~NODE_5327_length_669_cov_15.839483_g5164_i0.p2  ORF type:complete len:136 (-),score=33.13 NODE_5327_length_669_cov_15.839483_g5164_i0:106-513(-)